MHDDTPTPPRGAAGDDIEIEFVDVDPETGIEQAVAAPPDGATESDRSAAEIDRLREVIDQMQLELNQVRDHYLRKLAEFDNFRKRIEREREELQRTASELLVRELVPVLDNFDRAVRHAADSDAETFRKGVEMIARQLWDVLERQGLEAVDPTGQPFAPEYHEAVQRVENASLVPGTVAWTLAKGYLFSGKLLRPAMVGVVVPATVEEPRDVAQSSADSGGGERLP